MQDSSNSNFSKIKNIYLPLFDYQFDHGPSSKTENNKHFTGRKKILNRIQLLFENSDTDHGAYLVTGYRGMGKTSVVREAFNHKDEGSHTSFKDDKGLKIFNFALSQDEVRDIDLLRQIGWEIIRYSRKEILDNSGVNWLFFLSRNPKKILSWGVNAIDQLVSFIAKIIIRFSIFISCFSFCLYLFTPNSNLSISFKLFDILNDFKLQIPQLFQGEQSFGYAFLFFGLFAILFSTINYIASKAINNLTDISRLRRELRENLSLFEKRLYSSVIQEDASKEGINLGQTNPYTSIANRILNATPNGEESSTKNTLNYSIATSKEIEHYLSKTLESIHEIRKLRKRIIYKLFSRKIPSFVFIVDELDKIEPDYFFAPGDRESDQYIHHSEMPFHVSTKARRRQEAIAKLLANLKNFLTDVKAKFIFIGGRDIYDASLADISDRESFYSSIFNEVIYVETFFKDKIDSNAGLSELAQRYVSNFLFPNNYLDKDRGLKAYLAILDVYDSDEKFKLIHMLQNFFIFLLYRSNGSPKKLIELMERYITSLSKKEYEKMIEARDENISDYSVRVFKNSDDRIVHYLKFLREKRDALENELKNLKSDRETLEKELKDWLKMHNKNKEQYDKKSLLRPSSINMEKEKKEAKLDDIKILIISKTKALDSCNKNIASLSNDNKVDKVRLFDLSLPLNLFPKKNSTRTYFLKFSYKDQYEINLTSSLYRPYTIISSKHLKTLGDKLLYSSAFLMDHILKFHRGAFSWRNLEMIPDIILANKEPNFRQFFQNLINFLSHQHIRQTLNAIYQYKFHNRVKNELEYLSKTSEFSSAAFNFTLDESFHLKSYYKKKLAAKLLEYKQSGFHEANSDYVHSAGYLHSLIGDLHFYDEEYDDAIVHFTDAVQPMRKTLISGGRLMNHQFVLYCRNQLSLGLCLEKVRTYDKVYSIYRSLILNSNAFEPGANEVKKWEEPFKRIQLFLRPHIALLGVIEKQRNDGITYDNLERNILEYSRFLKLENSSLFPSERNELINYDNIKLASTPESIKKADKKRLVTLFVDYYISVGNMLFFKNQIFYRLLFDSQLSNKEIISKEIHDAFSANDSNYKNDYHPSHSAYLYYLHALANFNSPFIENYNYFENNENTSESSEYGKEKQVSLRKELLFIGFYIYNKPVVTKENLGLQNTFSKKYSILNSKQLETLANILGKLGDALLSCLYKSKQTEGENFIKYFKLKGLDSVFHSLNDSAFELFSLETVAILYKLSNEFYFKSGNIYEASFQIKKALYVIRDSITHYKSSPNENSIKALTQVVLNDQSEISKGANRAQISKYRIFTNDSPDFTGKIYRSLSTETEVKEVLCLAESIFMKMDFNYIPKLKIGCQNTISYMFTRIVELKLKSKANLRSIQKNSKLLKIKRVEINLPKAFLNFINLGIENKTEWEEEFQEKCRFIADGLFCNAQLIRILNTYGISYILNYSFLASVHRSMALFSIYFQIMKMINQDSYKKLKALLKELIGENTETDFDPFYHYDLCYQNYKKAKELHSEGGVYKEIIREMYTLDDDFNDNLTHFCAAIERYRINMGDTEKLIQQSSDFLNQTGLRFYNNYV